MAITILLIVAVLIAAILIYASAQPDTFTVERSTHIHAPAESIYPLIEDFHNWAQWSPYEALDADLNKTYSGASRGEGAVYEWEGKKAGVGRMEITDTQPPRMVEIDLRFMKPFKSRNTTIFALDEQEASTKVIWRMSGPMPFVSKLMCLVISMDRLVGKDFEKGLASMKQVAERTVTAGS